jgi:DNA-binding NarL/FixJ family response regulator
MDHIRVVILDDHPAIADGYRYRLMEEEDIDVVCVVYYGEDLIPALEKHRADILLLDMQVVTSRDDPTLFNTNHLVPQIQDRFPSLSILVISQFDQRSMVTSMLNAGADGYILKDDHEAYRDLPALVRVIAHGGMYVSARVRDTWIHKRTGELVPRLSPRQLEALSLCATYPNEKLPKLAERMSLSPSTMRVFLWETYHRLGVNSRAAAVSKARQIGLLPPEGMQPVP